jgi:hypothetical protein
MKINSLQRMLLTAKEKYGNIDVFLSSSGYGKLKKLMIEIERPANEKERVILSTNEEYK